MYKYIERSEETSVGKCGRLFVFSIISNDYIACTSSDNCDSHILYLSEEYSSLQAVGLLMISFSPKAVFHLIRVENFLVSFVLQNLIYDSFLFRRYPKQMAKQLRFAEQKIEMNDFFS